VGRFFIANPVAGVVAVIRLLPQASDALAGSKMKICKII
jgi:hypothetical protein